MSWVRRRLGAALLVLGVGLALNTILGPLFTNAIHYPLTDTLRNQTIGLEAMSLFVVAPLCVAAALLVLSGRSAGAVLALGPAAYTAYMFAQYVVGPNYLSYPRVMPLHLAMFILGGLTAIWAWSAIDPQHLPSVRLRTQRRHAIVVSVLTAFIISRYLPAFIGSWNNDRLPSEFRGEPAMYWSIFLLDLGVVVPTAVAAVLALHNGTRQAVKTLYAVIGWFALVPPSVAAMAVTMLAKDDPNRSTGQASLFIAAAIVFSCYALWLYRPLFRPASINLPTVRR